MITILASTIGTSAEQDIGSSAALSLSNLRDIVEPPAVSSWPPATGFWLLTALLAVWLITGITITLLSRKRNTYRRFGLEYLKSLESDLAAEQTRSSALCEIAELLKRVALAAYPRQQVAELHGRKWLEFLDQTGKTRDFTQGAGHLLPELLYEDRTVSLNEARDLYNLAAQWIKNHSSVSKKSGNDKQC